MKQRRPLPISNTGLGRTRGGIDCSAIPVPAGPSATASPAERDAALAAQDGALAQREACYRGQLEQLKSSGGDVGAARRNIHELLRMTGRERDA
jgi:hypothetical protein